MKIKTWLVLSVLTGWGFGLPASANNSDYSLIVSPARYSVVQVLFDVIQQRPAVMVTYQEGPSPDQPLLHVWNGNAWTQIGLHDLRELNFLQRTPGRAILIGPDDLLPPSVRDALSWMPELVMVREMNNAALLNELGRVMKWSNGEWKWFAKRYNLDIEDEAAALRQSSWYDQPGPIVKQGKTGYQPIPAGMREESLNTSTLEPIRPPSDLPSGADAAPAAPQDEIQAIVEDLEGGAADEAAPVK